MSPTALSAWPCHLLAALTGKIPSFAPVWANGSTHKRFRYSVCAAACLPLSAWAASARPVCAARAKALGMDVVFYDPFLPTATTKSLGIRRAESLEELLRQAYIVSLHTPLTDLSRHCINAQSLAWLPQGSYLVNTSRGAVVDTSIIPDAIASGQLAGAALDVLPHEPPPDHDPVIRAWRDPNHPAHHRLIVNAHAAFYTEQGFIDMRTKGATAIRRALTGQPIRNVVN